MTIMSRRSGRVWAFATLLAGCAGSRASESVDPDLVPLVSESAPPQAMLEPDEHIGPPDAPGADLIGEDPPARQGPTQHVTLDEEPAGNDKVVAPPKREKMPSLMGGLLWGPRDN